MIVLFLSNKAKIAPQTEKLHTTQRRTDDRRGPSRKQQSRQKSMKKMTRKTQFPYLWCLYSARKRSRSFIFEWKCFSLGDFLTNGSSGKTGRWLWEMFIFYREHYNRKELIKFIISCVESSVIGLENLNDANAIWQNYRKSVASEENSWKCCPVIYCDEFYAVSGAL